MKKTLVLLFSGIVFLETIRQLKKPRTGLLFLSHQEREILSLMAEGYTDNEITESLHVGKRTIERYLCNIPKKLNLQNISSAISYAIEKGWVSIAYA